ncbi:hypothetical protein PV05_06997 [Exophiala xenobiotica]|uniref:Uncharacterized protein n=1 Tax=Exophiala xenobiotica TaxID=348802 RepID=A0A0D2F422_9EURO|nr:uncharacterized protein PV05_06997 [Exophiala xenobiotica]KIW54649.1 hypothetical protein PV05_06997 [Exophiala xenobiotica]
MQILTYRRLSNHFISTFQISSAEITCDAFSADSVEAEEIDLTSPVKLPIPGSGVHSSHWHLLFNPSICTVSQLSIIFQHRKGGKKKPEYARYRSIQHFFNEKRQQLLDSVPPSYSFNGRVVPETRGQLIQPLPPGISRNALTDAAAIQKQKLKSSRRETKKEHNPQYCLGRYQLVSMWNADLVTKGQEDESERAVEKMRVLQKRYRLREYDPEKRGPQANQGADDKKRKTTKQGEADSREGANSEKQKMDNSEGGSRHGTTTLSAQVDGLDLKEKEICEAQGGVDEKSPRKKQDVNDVEAASSDAEVKMSAEVTHPKKKVKASLGAQDEAERGRPFRAEGVDTVGAACHIWNTNISARRRLLKRKRSACEKLQHEEKEPPQKKQKLGHKKSRRGRVSMVTSTNASMSLAARYIASVSCAQPSSILHGKPHKDPPQAIEQHVVWSKIDDMPQVIQKLEQKVQDFKEKENVPDLEQIGEDMYHARGDDS